LCEDGYQYWNDYNNTIRQDNKDSHHDRDNMTIGQATAARGAAAGASFTNFNL